MQLRVSEGFFILIINEEQMKNMTFEKDSICFVEN